MKEIIFTIVSGIILYYILRLVNFKRPKIEIKLKKGSNRISPVRNNYSELEYKGIIQIKNISSVIAFSICFYGLSVNNPFKNSRLNLDKLKPKEKIEEQIYIRKYLNGLERKKISCDPNYEPEEFDTFSIILKYKDKIGIPFFSKYERINKDEKCTYSFFKPTINKDIV